jgi:hypothetical protein
MCFATAALIAGVAGSAVSAGGQLYSGAAKAQAANYSAEVAKNNAIIAEQNADYSVAAGVQRGANQSLKGAAAGARLKTAQAASGIDVNKGSPVDVQVSQRETEKLDTDTTLNNALLEAYGYRSKATGFKAQSQLDKMSADASETGAIIGATGTLLSSASSLGMKWSGASGGSGAAENINDYE